MKTFHLLLLFTTTVSVVFSSFLIAQTRVSVTVDGENRNTLTAIHCPPSSKIKILLTSPNSNIKNELSSILIKYCDLQQQQQQQQQQAYDDSLTSIYEWNEHRLSGPFSLSFNKQTCTLSFKMKDFNNCIGTTELIRFFLKSNNGQTPDQEVKFLILQNASNKKRQSKQPDRQSAVQERRH
jgi:hypothetical protein